MSPSGSLVFGLFCLLCVQEVVCHLHNKLEPYFIAKPSHALRLIVRETSFGGTKVFTLEEHANHKPLKHKSEKEFQQHCKSSLCCMQISERLLPRVSRFNLNEPTAAWSQPAIPMIFGHFIISGCSHNSDLSFSVCWSTDLFSKKRTTFSTVSHSHESLNCLFDLAPQ